MTALAAAWLVGLGLLFQLLHYWDGHALRKTAILILIACLSWLLFRWTRTRRVIPSLPRLVSCVMVAAALFVLGRSLVRGVRTFIASRGFGDVLHDQGQIADRALRLLTQGVNPYGSSTMLDPLAFADQVQALARRPDCGAVNPDAVLQGFQDYWYKDLDPARMRTVVPAITDSAACHDLRVKFRSLGYHYGPVLLLAYAPFVALLGPAGIYAAHILAILVWLVLLGRWLKKNLVHAPPVPALAAITVFLLAPSLINYIFLQLAASDLIPTILACGGLLCWLAGEDQAAGLLVGLSVGAKLFPGMLFTPLLLRNRRAALVCAAAAAALYFPFAVWDAAGLYHNLLYPFTIRDTTSPLAMLPAMAGPLLKIAAVGGFGVWIWRLVIAGWPEREALLFLVSFHLAALILGGMSHNNYLIWPMSAIAVFWIRLVDRSGLSAPESAAA